jgi:hypothetical protein
MLRHELRIEGGHNRLHSGEDTPMFMLSRRPRLTAFRAAAIAVLFALSVSPLLADPAEFTTYASQNQGFDKVLLGPNLDPLLAPTIRPQTLVFVSFTNPLPSYTSMGILDIPQFNLHLTDGPFTGDCDGPPTC